MNSKTLRYGLTLTLLALGSTAWACPIRSGTMFHGNVSATPGLSPVCGTFYQNVRANLKQKLASQLIFTPTWTEVFDMTGNNALDIQRMTTNKLKSLGFHQESFGSTSKVSGYVVFKNDRTGDFIRIDNMFYDYNGRSRNLYVIWGNL